MAKRALTVTRFDGGLNCFSDARDIQDNEFFQSWNAVVDRAGILRMAGEGHSYISGLPHSQEYSSSSTNYIQPGWNCSWSSIRQSYCNFSNDCKFYYCC